MHSYHHNIKTFNNATRHLTRVERSLYRDLIELYYDSEKPIPADNFDRLARLVLANNDEEKAALRYVLDEFFVISGGSYAHDYCDEQIEKFYANTTAKALAGKASAKARKEKNEQRRREREKQNSTDVEQPSTDVEQNPTNHKPLTSNHEPIKTSTSESPTHDPVDPLLNCPHKAIIEIYHRILPELPRVLDTTWNGSSREKDLQARWRHDKRHQNLDFWEAYFEGVARSKFHLGDNDRGWKADLGWLVKRSNFDKMVERIQAEII